MLTIKIDPREVNPRAAFILSMNILAGVISQLCPPGCAANHGGMIFAISSGLTWAIIDICQEVEYGSKGY